VYPVFILMSKAGRTDAFIATKKLVGLPHYSS
jgi:hypothetical protein